MVEPLVVAATQATPVPGAVADNAALGARLVARAEGARVVVLPELFLSAYHPPTLYASESASVDASAEGVVDDARLDPLRAAAGEHRAVVVVGASVRFGSGRTCSALVVHPDGTVVVGYDKQNLWGPDERALFTPGDRGATLTVDGWRLGLGICYDGCFPEHGRAAAEDDVHACLYPSGYLAGSEHRRDVYYAARALDNTMYVVFANSVGGQAPYEFNGGAAIYEPEGRAVQKAANVGECVVVAELSRNALLETRTDHSMLVDRRSDLGGRRFLGA